MSDSFCMRCLIARGESLLEMPHTNISDIASDYAKCILEHDNNEIINLLGFSFGGFVAHAVSCLLEAAGKKVNLIMFDTDFRSLVNIDEVKSVEVIKHMLRAYNDHALYEDINAEFIEDLLATEIKGRVKGVLAEASSSGLLANDLWIPIFTRMRLAVSNTHAMKNLDSDSKFKGNLIWLHSHQMIPDSIALVEAIDLFISRGYKDIVYAKGIGEHSSFTQLPFAETNCKMLLEMLSGFDFVGNSNLR